MSKMRILDNVEEKKFESPPKFNISGYPEFKRNTN